MNRKSIWLLVLVALAGFSSLPAAAEDATRWEIKCSQDKVTLDWSCMAIKFMGDLHGSSLIVKHVPKVGYCFSGSRHTHPSRDAVIRIGENAPISYRKGLVCGALAEKIIEQLKEETDGATRGITFPSTTHQFEFNSAGFPAALEALQAAVASKQE